MKTNVTYSEREEKIWTAILVIVSFWIGILIGLIL